MTRNTTVNDGEWHPGEDNDDQEEPVDSVSSRQMNHNPRNSLTAPRMTLSQHQHMCVQMQAGVSERHSDLMSRVPSAGGYFPEVGTGAFDGLALLLANQKTAKSRGTGRKDRRKSKASPRTGKTERLRAPNFFPKSLAARAESYPPVPRNSPKRLEFSVADIILHHVSVLISACFAVKLNIEQLIAPKTKTRVFSSNHEGTCSLVRTPKIVSSLTQQ